MALRRGVVTLGLSTRGCLPPRVSGTCSTTSASSPASLVTRSTVASSTTTVHTPFRSTRVMLKESGNNAGGVPPTAETKEAKPTASSSPPQQKKKGGDSSNSAPPTKGGDKGGDKAAAAAPSAPVSVKPWRKFTATPWMMRNIPGGNSTSPSPSVADPVTVFFSGDKLGPKPMVVLDGVASNLDDAAALVEPYVPVLSSLNHKDGVICIPLLYRKKDDSDSSNKDSRDALSAYCDDVVRALDVLGVAWPSVVIGRSVGCLVAAKMALLYPERMGGLVSLDTPLASKAWFKNSEARAELLQLLSSGDTNVPMSTVEAHIHGITSDKESSLAVQHPTHFREQQSGKTKDDSGSKLLELQALSEEFYKKEIFAESAVYPSLTTSTTNTSKSSSFFFSDPAVKLARETAGVVRVDGQVKATHGSALAQVLFGNTSDADAILSGSAYVSPLDLASIIHPLLLVTIANPSMAATPEGDLLTHRATFNMRKPTILKAVKGDQTLMEALASPTASPAKGGDQKPTEVADVAENSGATSSSSSSTTDKMVAVSPAAQELATQLRQFGQRFDLFAGLVRRFEQSSADMLRSMDDVKSVAGGAATGGDSNKGSSKKKKGGDKKKP